MNMLLFLYNIRRYFLFLRVHVALFTVPHNSVTSPICAHTQHGHVCFNDGYMIRVTNAACCTLYVCKCGACIHTHLLQVCAFPQSDSVTQGRKNKLLVVCMLLSFTVIILLLISVFLWYVTHLCVKSFTFHVLKKICIEKGILCFFSITIILVWTAESIHLNTKTGQNGSGSISRFGQPSGQIENVPLLRVSTCCGMLPHDQRRHGIW